VTKLLFSALVELLFVDMHYVLTDNYCWQLMKYLLYMEWKMYSRHMSWRRWTDGVCCKILYFLWLVETLILEFLVTPIYNLL